MSRVLSGSEFNALYPDEKLVRIINGDYTHYDHIYVHGKNKDKIPFNPSGSCLPGGLYFTTERCLIDFLYIIINNGGKYIVPVSVPDDAQVYEDPEGNKYKASKLFVHLNDKKTLDEYYPELERIIFENIYLVDEYNIKYIAEVLFMYKKPLQITNARLLKKDYYEILKKFFIMAVSKNGTLLALIPIEFRTADVCMPAVMNCGRAIEFVPADVITPKMYDIAISDDYRTLKCIPKEYISPEICMSVVMKHGRALRYIPDELLNDDICVAAINRDIDALDIIPEEKRTYKMYLAAVNKCGSLLEKVPEPMKTDEICLAAVQDNGFALRFMPKEKRTHAICLVAVINRGGALEHVPEKTDDICDAAVLKCGMALRYIPEEKKTIKRCAIAVKNYGWALQYIPGNIISEDMCLDAIGECGSALQYIPMHLLTLKMCMIAVSRDGSAIFYVPSKFLTESLCKAAIKSDYRVIKMVHRGHNEELKLMFKKLRETNFLNSKYLNSDEYLNSLY